MICEIKSLKDFDAFKSMWGGEKNSIDSTIFQSFAWNRLLFKQWNKSPYNRNLSKVYIIYTENLLLPVIVQKISFGFKWFGRKKGIYILGDDSYSDYLNIIECDDIDNATFDKEMNVLIEEISALGMPIFLNNIREDSRLARWLDNKGYKRAHESVAVSIIFPQDYKEEDYNKSLSKNTRQNLRTAGNRMKKDGVNYELEIRKGVLPSDLVELLIPIHLKRVMEINNFDGSVLNKISTYFRRKRLSYNEIYNNIVSESMKIIDKSITVIVRCNGEIAGYLYGFKEDDNIVRIIHNCVIDKYKWYSPMFKGTYEFVLECLKRSMGEVDFTRGDEEYKYKLGGKNRIICNYILQKPL